MRRDKLRDISHREALIIELVYELARGTEEEMGYSLEEIVTILQSKVEGKDGRTTLECLHDEEHDFIAEAIEKLK